MKRTWTACPLGWAWAAATTVGEAAGVVDEVELLVVAAGLAEADVVDEGAVAAADAGAVDVDGVVAPGDGDVPQPAKMAETKMAAPDFLSRDRRDSEPVRVAGMGSPPRRIS